MRNPSDNLILTISLIRQYHSDQGTFGTFSLNGKVYYTGELPWRNNEADFSCIPVGTYQCVWLFSPHFGRNLYHIQNVPNRSDCLIHMGNWCGDTTKGFKSDVEGCILLGLDMGLLENQDAVLQSDEGLAQFESILKGDSFMLQITEEFKD